MRRLRVISDIFTIMWKEWKEFLLQRGSLRGTLASQGLMVIVFGVVLPMQSGRAWIESPVSLAAWAWMPLFLVSGMIADSFAGERERHTLETLLASRLSDRAILLGKIAAGVGYALAMTLVLLVVGLVVVNVSDWSGQLAIYPATTLVGFMIFSTLGAGLVAGIGVIISLRAATVRQAAQALSMGILLIVWIPILGMQLLPQDIQRRALDLLGRMDDRLAVPLLLLALIALDAIILSVAHARFQRARLILD
jgi:ABC-2 type transport system permease protein